MTPLYKHPAFRDGLRDMGSVAPGLGAWGLMTGVASLRVPLLVDVGVGPNWEQAH